jgi:hypothetical protein
MYPIISLIFRILSGEKLEPATKQNTAYWLSALVVIPLAIVGFAELAQWLESLTGSPFDNTVSLVLFMLVVGLVLLGAIFSLAKICRDHPVLLVLLSFGAWGMTAILMWRHA